jgi:serpin B
MLVMRGTSDELCLLLLALYKEPFMRTGIAVLLCGSLVCGCSRNKQMSSNVAATDGNALIRDNVNALAIKLYSKLASNNKTDNICFSPVSIESVLGMMYAASSGETASEMAKAMDVSLSVDNFAKAYHQHYQDLRNVNRFIYDGNHPTYWLDIYNTLFSQRGYHLKFKFQNMLSSDFEATFMEVDFADTNSARQIINERCARLTSQMIGDFVPEGMLNESALAVILNTTYFQSGWSEKFKKDDTKDEPFRLLTGKSIAVPMMHTKKDLVYYDEDKEVLVLDLHYDRGDLSMVVILPKRPDGLKDAENHLTASNLDKWWRDTKGDPEDVLDRCVTVEVAMPRFDYRDKIDLTDTLKTMGMRRIFDPAMAECGGMSNQPGAYVSYVLHEATISVDEEGTVAAAATVAAIFGEGPVVSPKVFKADHPFVFFIRHNPTGTILFIGRLTNPASSS